MRSAKPVLLLLIAFFAAHASPGDAADGPAFGAGAKGVLGTWIAETYSERLRTAEGVEPPLNSAGLALYRTRTAEHDSPQPQFDRTRWCAGPGVPRIMMLPYPFEIRADGDYIGFLYGWYRWHRMVDMSGATPDPVLPQTMGYPVGRWEGTTLVIETTGIAGETVLDGFGLPHSEGMTLTERVRALPGGRLEVRFTIDDAAFYTQPWTALMTYKHPRNPVIADDVCPDRIAKGEPAVQKAQDTKGDPRYFGGIWESERFFFLIGNTPKLPKTQQMVDGYAAAMKSGQILYTAWTSCRPGAISAMAMVMNSIVVLQTAKDITISLEEPRMTRRIRLDSAHPKNLEPSYLGDSIGHWEGNTLVVDTIGFNGNFELDAAAQPTSPKLHTVERFTKSADGKRIAVEVTISDPEYYSDSFKIERGWLASSKRHQMEYDCMENPRSEEFDHTLFIKEMYRPTCQSYQGEGLEPSHIVCGKP